MARSLKRIESNWSKINKKVPENPEPFCFLSVILGKAFFLYDKEIISRDNGESLF